MKKLFLAASFSLLGIVALQAQQQTTTEVKPVEKAKEVTTTTQNTTTETIKAEAVDQTQQVKAEVKDAQAEVEAAKAEVKEAKKEATREDKKKKKKEKVE